MRMTELHVQLTNSHLQNAKCFMQDTFIILKSGFFSPKSWIYFWGRQSDMLQAENTVFARWWGSNFSSISMILLVYKGSSKNLILNVRISGLCLFAQTPNFTLKCNSLIKTREGIKAKTTQIGSNLPQGLTLLLFCPDDQNTALGRCSLKPLA